MNAIGVSPIQFAAIMGVNTAMGGVTHNPRITMPSDVAPITGPSPEQFAALHAQLPDCHIKVEESGGRGV